MSIMASGMTDAEAWTRLVQGAASYDQGNPSSNIVALRTTAQIAMWLGRQPNPYEEIARLKTRVAELEDMSNGINAEKAETKGTSKRIRLPASKDRRR